MVLAGDEFLRTQGGNNNAWCQDNEVSWVHWEGLHSQAGFFRFARMMLALRQRHPALRRREFFRGAGLQGNLPPDVIWHGVEPFEPDFSSGSRTLALCLDGQQSGRETDRDFYMAFNAWREPLAFRIPRSPNGNPWRRVIDTGLDSPNDILELDTGPVVAPQERYPLVAHGLVVLIAEA